MIKIGDQANVKFPKIKDIDGTLDTGIIGIFDVKGERIKSPG